MNRGIVVNDYLQTSWPDVYAVGECREHRGVCYGLVAPLFEQGQVLAKHLCGVEGQPYEGSIVSTKLKISGVDVFSAGEFMEQAEHAVITAKDDWRKTYKKILIRDNIIVGAILFGDVSDSASLQSMIRKKTAMTDEIYDSIMGTDRAGTGGGKAFSLEKMPDDEIVCGRNGVTKKPSWMPLLFKVIRQWMRSKLAQVLPARAAVANLSWSKYPERIGRWL